MGFKGVYLSRTCFPDDTRRILRQDGVLFVSTILSSTISESVWYLQLQTDIRDKIARFYMSAENYRRLFDKHAFRCITAINILTEKGSANNSRWDSSSPLSEEWRKATSMFDIASEEEIDAMTSTLLEKKTNGTIDKFIADFDFTHERGLVTLYLSV